MQTEECAGEGQNKSKLYSADRNIMQGQKYHKNVSSNCIQRDKSGAAWTGIKISAGRFSNYDQITY